MTTANLQGKKVAILVTDGFEQSELLEPRKALDEAGATTKVVSPADKRAKGWNHKEWGNDVPVDVPLDSAKADEFDALLLPGGVMNPDQLRMNPEGGRVCEALHQRRQAGGGDLSWTLDVDRSWRGSRSNDDIVAIAQDRLEECGRKLGR